MKRIPTWKILLILLLPAINGCACWGSGNCNVHHERTEELSASLPPGGSLAAETDYGSIDVRGGDVSECRVEARITGRARTEKEARRIAQETKVALMPSGGGLELEVDKPSFRDGRNVSVDLKIHVPKQTRLDIATDYGNLSFSDVEADVKGKTGYGGVTARRLAGRIELFTDYGHLSCRGMSGDLHARTCYGSVDAEFTPSAPRVCTVKLVTEYGNINLTPPIGFSAAARISTDYGSISTDVPMTMEGNITKSLRGIINEGEGELLLTTSYGSIRIKRQGSDPGA